MSEEKVKKEKKPRSKASKIVEWVITGIFSVLFIFVLIGFIDGMAHKKQYYGESIRLGWGSFIVETDSMADHLPVKSAILTYRDSPESIYKKYQKQIAERADHKCTIDITFYYDQVRNFTPDDPTLTKEEGLLDHVTTHRIREIHIDESKKNGEGRYIFVVAGTNSQSDQNKESQFQVITERQYLGVVKVCSNFLGGVFRFITSIWGLLILLLIPAFYLVIVSVLDIFKAYKEDDEKVVATQGADGSVIAGESKLNNISASERERLKQELLQEMINKKKADAAKNEKKEEKIDA